MSPQAGKKSRMLDRVAETNGVAVVVLDKDSREVSVSNNNSICRALTRSTEFAPKCAEYCGVAFRETADGTAFEYTCYAGLTCKAVPVADRGKRFVAIVGRTFISADNYLKATERAITGDWRDFAPNEFFENVSMAGSVSRVEAAVEELSQFRVSETDDVLDLDARPTEHNAPQTEPATEPVKESPSTPISAVDDDAELTPTQLIQRRATEAAELRSLYGQLAKLEYTGACETVLEFIASTFKLDSLVWLERKNNRFVITAARGALLGMPVKIGIPADSEQFLA